MKAESAHAFAQPGTLDAPTRESLAEARKFLSIFSTAYAREGARR